MTKVLALAPCERQGCWDAALQTSYSYVGEFLQKYRIMGAP
jgi:hypothetical protein